MAHLFWWVHDAPKLMLLYFFFSITLDGVTGLPVPTITNWTLELQSRTNMVAIITAPWCRFCKALDPVFQQVAEIYGDRLPFLYVSGGYSRPFTKLYGVTEFPTLLFCSNGSVVDRHYGVSWAPRDLVRFCNRNLRPRVEELSTADLEGMTRNLGNVVSVVAFWDPDRCPDTPPPLPGKNSTSPRDFASFLGVLGEQAARFRFAYFFYSTNTSLARGLGIRDPPSVPVCGGAALLKSGFYLWKASTWPQVVSLIDKHAAPLVMRLNALSAPYILSLPTLILAFRRPEKTVPPPTDIKVSPGPFVECEQLLLEVAAELDGSVRFACVDERAMPSFIEGLGLFGAGGALLAQPPSRPGEECDVAEFDMVLVDVQAQSHYIFSSYLRQQRLVAQRRLALRRALLSRGLLPPPHHPPPASNSSNPMEGFAQAPPSTPSDPSPPVSNEEESPAPAREYPFRFVLPPSPPDDVEHPWDYLADIVARGSLPVAPFGVTADAVRDFLDSYLLQETQQIAEALDADPNQIDEGKDADAAGASSAPEISDSLSNLLRAARLLLPGDDLSALPAEPPQSHVLQASNAAWETADLPLCSRPLPPFSARYVEQLLHAANGNPTTLRQLWSLVEASIPRVRPLLPFRPSGSSAHASPTHKGRWFGPALAGRRTAATTPLVATPSAPTPDEVSTSELGALMEALRSRCCSSTSRVANASAAECPPLVVLFCTPTCGPCKTLFLAFESVAATAHLPVGNRSDAVGVPLRMVLLDLSLNDPPSQLLGFKVMGNPAIAMYTAQTQYRKATLVPGPMDPTPRALASALRDTYAVATSPPSEDDE
ncbi:hypothetical protein PAPYR_5003 [Paratrimastix pyriformis]|uniref:Thioredoxin domain-containing protein n=1 Tax=Paratrimastix pyriformis TaxID=342808 RepID=A0ABQ8UNB3_9EUKA|nr:hypothetical protein PAPYR_5003 [Paratrimastix pyriformis]